MIILDKLAEKVFGILKGYGYVIRMYDTNGNETVEPEVGRRFFVPNPGLMVTINDQEEELQLSKSNSSSLAATENLQKNLKQLANEYLLNYTVRVYGKKFQPRDFSYQAKAHRNGDMNKVAEASLSRMKGSRKTSYQQLESVKLLVKHRKDVDEDVRGSRSRNISAIFLEQGGIRTRFPHNHLAGARAMARHMYRGGIMEDKVGSYIINKTEQMIKLREFLIYVNRNKLLSEDTTDIVQTVKENMHSLRVDLKRLSGVKTYETMRCKIEEQEAIELQEDDIASLRDMFTVRRFDEKFDEVLPVVKLLMQERDNLLHRIEESSKGQIFLSRNGVEINSILEFNSKLAELGFKLTEMASRIIENNELAGYMRKIGKKLCIEQELSAFETDIMRNVLKNAIPEVIQEQKSEIKENTDYEKFFEKYSYIFVLND